MQRAFRDLFGVEDAFGRIEFSGRTDTAIFRDAARAHGIGEAALDEAQARFMDAYVPHLEAALHEVAGALMPGIADALEALAEDGDVMQALGTGNFRRGGELKLRHFGIDKHFPGVQGGFGEDSESRDEVIALAIRRLTNADGHGTCVIVIGDTPHDVTAAKANGAFALGVATGRNSVAELTACGADIALEDLRDTAALLRIVAGAA